ncbi:MAG TPA: Ig-like domain-containing protein [Solirubrobacterales bacterium]|nr:Ig-like domain-containing protein [Solirubrobacterales bacterium]
MPAGAIALAGAWCLIAAPAPALAASPAHLHGTASYADLSPDAGVEVTVGEDRSGPVRGHSAWTDEAGNWDVGFLPPGPYTVSYSVEVSNGSPDKRQTATVGFEKITLGEGEDRQLTTTLVGPKPEGLIEASVIAAEGFKASMEVNLLFPSGEPERRRTEGETPARFTAPTGTYTLEVPVSANTSIMDQGLSQPVSVANGHITRVDLRLNPLALPAGTQAPKEAQLLSMLNAERARWGIPGNIVGVPLWSRGCAAHDIYGARNRELQHSESPVYPGFSPGGDWAGEHSVLAADGSFGWRADGNPWMDAPYHLEQLFTPWIGRAGVDDTRGYQCATTIPGIEEKSSAPAGTVWTFPGDGTTGLPPVEDARERPKTPNEDLGLKSLTGRQLFVWESGTHLYQLDVTSASLSSPAGPVNVKWVDGGISGAIIIPVQPLKPFTTYTASVTLAPFEESNGEQVSAKTHTWSFTTGYNNPSGGWHERAPTPKKKKLPRPPLKLKVQRINPHEWRIQIKAGRVLLGRHATLAVRRERPLCKKGRAPGGKGGCTWDWFALGKKRRQTIVLRRHSGLRLHLANLQRASVRVRTLPFSKKGKRYSGAVASVLLVAPKRR